MTLILALAVLILCGCLSSAYKFSDSAVAASGDQQLLADKEIKAAMGKRLEVDMRIGGSIVIEGWNQELVAVKVYDGGRECLDCSVQINETPSGVHIFSGDTARNRNHSNSLRLEIKVPQRFNLDLHTAGGGFTIENVEGSIQGKTMGGGLKLTNLRGELDLTTMGGAISLTNSEVNGRVKTMGGEVLLQDVRGDVEGVSMGGNVIYKNVTGRNGETTGEEVHIKTMGGDIKVETAPAGAEVLTMGGDIMIGSASKFINAKTMGGDINLSAIDGWVKATTMGGDIFVNLLGEASGGRHDVELTSYSGDITLTVPANLSMNFDISLAYTKNREGDYKITSDFEMQQRESADWVYDEGSPRKYIYGTGSVAGGANRIKIKTINGNVIVKKG
jgi:DUF4097 and DUF4098 domain-containing protein YvlB